MYWCLGNSIDYPINVMDLLFIVSLVGMTLLSIVNIYIAYISFRILKISVNLLRETVVIRKETILIKEISARVEEKL